MKRKIFAGILLTLLIVVPFINWQLGAVLWMCAWLVFIFQNIFSRRTWKLGDSQNEDDESDTHPQSG
jgi:ABC-type transport system involved in cytochrome bd biosynthesis fused ATPase/permease subunit